MSGQHFDRNISCVKAVQVMGRSSLVQYLPRMQKALGLVPSATYTCALPYAKFFLRDGTVLTLALEIYLPLEQSLAKGKYLA